MIRISVCMIVKNEESNLAPCLECLSHIMDELIIVDTGSTDRTKEIAARYTDKIYDFVWTGDFSEARNYAFSLADMEYIYSADADERLDAENQQRFLMLKQALLPEIEIVQMRYANQLENSTVYNFDEEYRPKLFRRLRQFRWISPIHETVATAPVVFDSDIVIGHYPKESHAGRDLAALRRVTEGMRLDVRLQHMYAMELYIAGDTQDFLSAEDYFSDAIIDASRTADEVLEARCIVAHSARLRGDTETFYRVVLPGVVGNPPAEICCEIAEFYYSRQNARESANWFYTAVQGAICLLTVRAGGSWPMEGLSRCYEALGDYDTAAHWKMCATEWNPPVADEAAAEGKY